jgi:hypothetical protein
MTEEQWRVKPGDRVRRGEWGYVEVPGIGTVLAVLPVPGRWPDMVVILPGGRVEIFRRWAKAAEEAEQ